MKRAVLVLLLLFGSPPVFAQTDLTVTSVNPPDGAMDVDNFMWPELRFSAEVDPATLNDTTVFLLDQASIRVPRRLFQGADGSRITLVRDPHHPLLSPGETYRLNVTPGLQDVAGNMAVDFASSFATVFIAPENLPRWLTAKM
jgi:hypothetical protein